MANDITKNPIIIDTAGPAVIWNGRGIIENVEFSGYVLDTDEFEIQDASGRSIWKGNGKADLSPIRSGKLGIFNGLIVPTLSAPGVLYIYIK